MSKLLVSIGVIFLVLNLSYAENQPQKEGASRITPKIILLISEQNIESPQHTWWASEIDLSVIETTIAKELIQKNYTVLEPSSVNKVIQKQAAFRKVALSEPEFVSLGKLAKADYVVLGRAIASAGANIPQSNMRSCFANVTAKLIQTRDGSVVGYFDASGNSAHLDVITGGREALIKAGIDLGSKLIAALEQMR